MTHYFCSKMIGIKKLNRKGKQVLFYDENLSSKVKSKFEMDLDKFLIPNNKSHVYLVT
ncbi:hypothetical protein HanXRQr2_Chr15g0676651 [Helianthus annuus]|uniref:Uncharacterized protein n=1 Tax=Helianthus annuus TaxID=4232 RepID=A0A251S691_HELAN|nr:hypothetical protein HanXRQr2_Chr15g0676651 [Helianthus annuus]KAJ0471817.1 hypothetical protein HanHA89_Chr15g0600251 [Helianthus annuus]KAJ0638602.1 hypothetical protein HanHA300_Chr00c0085g0706201 [Helianthus annuus]KAJ0829881.1 hypothetical protein HanPSC8_Chr15g0648861 [Helianthus annuus]